MFRFRTPAPNHNRHGFTLVQMSMMLTVVGIMAASAIVGSDAGNENGKRVLTQQRMNAIENATVGFMAANGRRPCPAVGSSALGSAAFGAEAATPGTCTGTLSSGNMVLGAVPTKALGLSDDYAFDGYGRRISYAVDKRATDQTTCQTINNKSGDLNIYNTTSGTLLESPHAAYVSHGRSGQGAFPMEGGSRIFSGITDLDKLRNANMNTGGNASMGTSLIRKAATATFDDLTWTRQDTRFKCCMGDICNVATDCTTPWGATVNVGDSVTAYSKDGTTLACSSEVRICNAGTPPTLSGSYTLETCNSGCALTADQGGGYIDHAQTLNPAYASNNTNCTSINTATCTNGTLSCSTGNMADCAYNTCSANPGNCTAPWGGNVADGATISAYPNSTGTCTAYNLHCASGVISCSDGFSSVALSNCQYASCTSACNLPWGGTIANGASVTAYLGPAGASCTSQTRTCTNSVLSGTYQYQACTITPGCNYDSSTDIAASARGIDASDTSAVRLKFSTDGMSSATASGTVGTTTLTTSADVSASLMPGVKIRVGAPATTSQLANVVDTEVYTVAAVNGTTITTVEPLTTTYNDFNLYRGLVTSVLQYGGGANGWAQSTESKMPLWVSNGLNGRGALYFDGGDTLKEGNATFGTPFSNGTGSIVAVGAVSTSAPATFLLYDTSTTAARRFYGSIAANILTFARDNGYGSITSALTYGRPFYMLGTYNDASSSLHINGGTLTGSISSVTPANASKTVVGSDAAQTGSFYKGLIGEIGYFGVAADPTCAHTFLDAKWGMAGGCGTPWGTVIANGANVTAYQTATGGGCVSETRTCTNGTLSGTYLYHNCIP